MKKNRPIIDINEELCNGCGECILSCAEGALALVDGKARLVGEIYCDGLGACLKGCPTGALTVTERECDDFDEAAVETHLNKQGLSLHDPHAAVKPAPAPVKAAPATIPCGCPGSAVRVIEPRTPAKSSAPVDEIASELRQWPVQLGLLGPHAPFLKNADLLLMADCVAVAYPELHRKLLPRHALAIACPKLDNLEAHIKRLADILQGAPIKSLTVLHMEVPCCHGIVHAAEEAIKRAGVNIPVRRMQVAISGEIIDQEIIRSGGVDQGLPCGCCG